MIKPPKKTTSDSDYTLLTKGRRLAFQRIFGWSSPKCFIEAGKNEATPTD